MKKEQLLENLLRKGAIVRVECLFLMLAHAEFLDESRLFFVCTFPEGQQHAHILEFESVELIWQRDIALIDGNGKIHAYIAEFREVPEIDVRAAFAEHDAWLAHISEPTEAKVFHRFVTLERHAYAGTRS